jgi:ATP-dependent RNA helicase DeaD
MDKFRNLGIPEEILNALKELKFETPTEIQEKTIPLVLAGKDVIAGASTGSGKTLAFGSGIIHNCKKQEVIQALVLVPTRELANQVAQNLRMFAKFKPLEIVEVYGGVSMGPQVRDLEIADVVVGTPGRILDHLSRGTIDLRNVKILVLDEADRMLDMGFIEDVKQIISGVSHYRQTLLFSATISREVSRLASSYMNQPTEVSAETYVDPSKLRQTFYDVPDNLKFSLLVKLLKEEHPGLIMVFCNTQRNTDFVAQNLRNNDIDALAIHGGLSQEKRNRIMLEFHAQKVTVLVCTDVAARGLDIKGVSHVYNYDIPNMPDQYVHRIGRTARAGKEGKAINILASRDYDNFAIIKKRLHFDIEREELPEVPRVNITIQRDSRGGFRRGGSGFRGRGSFGRGRDYGRRDSGFKRRFR